MLLFALLVLFIGSAAGLAWFLIAHDRGQKEPVMMLWGAAAFGLAGAIAAAFIEPRLVPLNNLLPGVPNGTLLLSMLAVAAIEEGCKFVPLALVLYRKPYFNEHTDGVIYFALAGLGFGLPENLFYTLQFGAQTGLLRLVMTSVFHAATTGLVGYYLIRCKLSRRSPFRVGLPLLGVILLHALYDFGLSSLSPLYAALSVTITVGASLGLFVLFLRATELDQEEGLSAVGNNSADQAASWPTVPAQRRSGQKALWAVLFGLAGLAGTLFAAASGLVLGLAGIVMGSLSRSGSKRGLSTAGLFISSLAILAGLGVWTYAVSHDPALQGNTVPSGNSLSAPAVSTASVSTPCYSVGLVDRLNVINNPHSCDMNAFNGPTLTSSTNVYKVYANTSPTADAENFAGLARRAIEKDIRTNLPDFTITGEQSAEFAGSPAYIAKASDQAQRLVLVEAAVFHSATTGQNVFILVHAANGASTDLSILEAQWQWK